MDVPGANNNNNNNNAEEEKERKSNSISGKDRRLQTVAPLNRKEADDWLARCRRNLETALPLDSKIVS